MGFLNPYMFGFIAFIAAFILLYFFRKQFERKVVSSNMLWIQVMDEREATPWFHKLQQNLLFWLQLIALLFLLVALLRPYWYGEGVKGEELIFVVDTSASMTAEVGSKTVFERKKEDMKSIVRRLRDQEVTMITTGLKPEIVLQRESNRSKIVRAIDELTVTYEHENMDKALRLARALSEAEHTAIHVFSDAVKEEIVTDTIKDRYVRVHNRKEDVVNVSIKSFGIGQSGGEMKGIAILENQSGKEVEANFSVKGEGGPLMQNSLLLKPRSETMIPIGPLPEEGFYQGILEVDDDYSADNVYTFINDKTDPPVYIIGTIHPFIIRGLESLGVDVVQLDGNQSEMDREGIVVTGKESEMGSNGMAWLYVDISDHLEPLTDAVEQRHDPLLRYVDLGNVHIAKSRPSSPFTGLETIAWSGDRPLIQRGKSDGIPIIALLFPLEQTDWPLHPNFPIFLYNSYQWLTHQSNHFGYFQPGEKRWLTLESSSLEIYSSEGENLYNVNTAEKSFQAPFEPGIYEAVSGNKRYFFSVLLDDREKRVPSGESFVLNEALLDGKEGNQEANDSLWFFFALSAFLVLMMEWEVYRRRARI